MGFRSNFITEDYNGIDIPQWFVDKYPKHIYGSFENKKTFPIIQPWESKFYLDLKDTEIFQDIQKILINQQDTRIVLILLHECGGITRVQISKDSIKGNEPSSWTNVTEVEHNYCYGCSNVEEGETINVPVIE